MVLLLISLYLFALEVEKKKQIKSLSRSREMSINLIEKLVEKVRNNHILPVMKFWI